MQVDIKLDDYGVGEDEDEEDQDESEEEDDDGGLPFKMDEDGEGEEVQPDAGESSPGNSTGADTDMAASAAVQSTPSAAAQHVHQTDSTAEKLDRMMDMLFSFIKQQCRNREDETGQRQADDLFRAMMRVFNSTILTT